MEIVAALQVTRFQNNLTAASFDQDYRRGYNSSTIGKVPDFPTLWVPPEAKNQMGFKIFKEQKQITSISELK